jgi:hypothetical protein
VAIIDDGGSTANATTAATTGDGEFAATGVSVSAPRATRSPQRPHGRQPNAAAPGFTAIATKAVRKLIAAIVSASLHPSQSGSNRVFFIRRRTALSLRVP